MNPARVEERGLLVQRRRAATLLDHRLVFDKIGGAGGNVGHANVVRAWGERVEGALYDLASPAEIFKMDPFEQAPVNYTREAVALAVDNETQWAWTYYANLARRAPGLRPTRVYLNHLLAGSDLLSPEYHAVLVATACTND